MSAVESAAGLASHQHALLLQRRCPHCAEPVDGAELLRGGACPHCEGALAQADLAHAGPLLLERLRRRRLPIYVTLALGGLLAGMVPVLPALLRLGALIALHHWYVQPPLGWLSPRRRLCTRVTLRLWLAVLAWFTALLDLAASPFPGAAPIVGMVASLLAAVAYGEGSLTLLKARFELERDGLGLHVVEWLVPAVLVVMLAGSVVGLVFAVAAVFYVLAALLH